MPALIPTFPDESNYSIAPTLDGTIYELTFRFSERQNLYMLDLSLNDGTLLVGGQPAVCSVSLYRRYRYNALVPQGHLIIMPATGLSDDPPAIGDLGSSRRCSLFYFTLAEVGS